MGGQPREVRAVRTLVISDLHLGGRVGRDVLRAPVPRARLLAALDGIDRLVLLGDTVELTEARPPEAMALAEPVLRDIATRLGPDTEIVVVPGNHDRLLIRAWLRAPGRVLGLDTKVPAGPDLPLLQRLVGWLGEGGATVTIRYPGVWLDDRIWATHGHYLDRHLLPESAFGIARGLLGRLPRDGATPMAYEQRQSVTDLEGPLTRLLPRWLTARVDDLIAALRRATMHAPRAVASGPDSRWMTRVRGRLLGLQMLRASIPALARVVHRLGVDADDVIFGHVHRLGPREGDDPRQWVGPSGTPRIHNTGSWVHESLLLHQMRPPHPYWPGGVLLVQDGRITPLALLEDVPGADLHP